MARSEPKWVKHIKHYSEVFGGKVNELRCISYEIIED